MYLRTMSTEIAKNEDPWNFVIQLITAMISPRVKQISVVINGMYKLYFRLGTSEKADLTVASDNLLV